MREILFRGKDKEANVWLYGDLIVREADSPTLETDESFKEYYICNMDYDGEINTREVIPETVGEFTGLLDKNGVRIFEGDLLRKPSKDQYEKTSFVLFEVFYHDENMCDSHIGWQFNRLHFQGNICGHSGWERFRPEYTGNMVVVGNIHDNKDLLNG